MRYIDADKIDWRLIELTNMIPAEEHMITLARKLVDRQPTAEVKPIVHGKWVKHDDEYRVYYECSICHMEFIILDGTPMIYCPNCDADMREEDKECGEPIPHWRGQMDGCLPFQKEEQDEV